MTQPVGQRLVVVGQGYVGLPLALRAVEAGFDVVGLEIDERRLERLEVGASYVDDVTSVALSEALASGRYHPAGDATACQGFDVAVISVPTPLREGVPDLTYVEEATSMLGPFVRRGCTVVLESTTYPGTTEEVVRPILEAKSGLQAGSDFHLGFSPERIDPGNPKWDLANTPKLVSGLTPASLAAVRGFFDCLVDTTVPVSRPREAELAKLLENTFRYINIALINELAMFAHDADIDIWEVIEVASTKPFGFMKFTPGPGVGGHCLPIDPAYLDWRVRGTVGRPFRFVELAHRINSHMPAYVVERLTAGLESRGVPVSSANVLILGLAYKRNSGDAREAPAEEVIQHLLKLGARVRACDPYATIDLYEPSVGRVELTSAELAMSDAVLLLTDHDTFDYELVTLQSRYVLDTRGRLSGSNVESL